MIRDEFISKKNKKYKYQIGKEIASSLAGFVAGFLVAAVVLVPLVFIVCRGRGL